MCVVRTAALSFSNIALKIQLLVAVFALFCCCLFEIFDILKYLKYLIFCIPSASFPVPCTYGWHKIDVKMFEWAFFCRSVSVRTVSAICREREHVQGGPAVCSGLWGRGRCIGLCPDSIPLLLSVGLK